MVGPPSQVSVCPSPALAVGWFGHRSVAPPAAPVCWALVESLLRRSVALGSCVPYPVGSSLEDSYGFVVQATGVFLDSLLGFFPLPSSCYGGLGVVVACTSCGVPCLWLALCSSACVSHGGCPSFSQVDPAHSHWVLFSGPRVRVSFVSFLLLCIPSRCVTRWVNRAFLSLLIADEGLHCWLFLSDFATLLDGVSWCSYVLLRLVGASCGW